MIWDKGNIYCEWCCCFGCSRFLFSLVSKSPQMWVNCFFFFFLNVLGQLCNLRPSDNWGHRASSECTEYGNITYYSSVFCDTFIAHVEADHYPAHSRWNSTEVCLTCLPAFFGSFCQSMFTHTLWISSRCWQSEVNRAKEAFKFSERLEMIRVHEFGWIETNSSHTFVLGTDWFFFCCVCIFLSLCFQCCWLVRSLLENRL